MNSRQLKNSTNITMDTKTYFNEHFELLPLENNVSGLEEIRQKAFHAFKEKGIPTSKHEDWKYTPIGTFLNKEFEFPAKPTHISEKDVNAVRLPSYKQAN